MTTDATLEQLKQEISSQRSIETKYQRLFHMGREMKNNKSLDRLGVGKFGVFVVHLHSSQPKGHQYTSSSSSSSSSKNAESRSGNLEKGGEDDTICILDGSNHGSSSRGVGNNRRRRRKKRNIAEAEGADDMNMIRIQNGTSTNATSTTSSNNVVDLLDSDDDDDDDDDVVEIVNVGSSTGKRSRQL